MEEEEGIRTFPTMQPNLRRAKTTLRKGAALVRKRRAFSLGRRMTIGACKHSPVSWQSIRRWYSSKNLPFMLLDTPLAKDFILPPNEDALASTGVCGTGTKVHRAGMTA